MLQLCLVIPRLMEWISVEPSKLHAGAASRVTPSWPKFNSFNKGC